MNRAFSTLAAFVLGGVLSYAFYLALGDANPSGAGQWIMDFAKSPGAGGVAAVLAASIAAYALSRQLRLDRKKHEHGQTVERDKSWWQSFEWAVARGLPLDPAHKPLPIDVATTTLSALADSASTDVQRMSCGGMLDYLTASRGDIEETLASEESPGKRPDAQESEFREMTALSAYVESTKHNAARSTGAESRLYELHVLEALEFLRGGGALQNLEREPRMTNIAQDFRPDAIISVNNIEVLIEIKHWTGERGASNRSRLRDIVGRVRTYGLNQPILVIAPAAVEVPETLQTQLKVRTVVWRDADDNADLLEALDKLIA